ncbi:MAG TPA: hypothetical protein VGI39_32460 [Polyangiaceae bacterium]|jgi:hypothetical protein
MRTRAILAPLLAFALLFTSASARADDQRDLDKVRAAYLARQYDLAEARLHALLDPKSGTLHDATLITQARMYLAAVHLATGDQPAAATVVERLLLDDPQFEPDPLSFPTEVIDFFIDARARLRDKLNAQAQERARLAAERRAREEEQKRREAEWLATLERMAREEKVTFVHSRAVALIPFGVGQFQNGNTTLGWGLLGTELALTVATGITVPIYLGELQGRSDAFRRGDTNAATQFIDRANTVFVLNLTLVGILGTVAVAGVIEAQANYVPSVVEVKTRPLPKVSWSVMPTAAPALDGRGGVLGVVGTF